MITSETINGSALRGSRFEGLHMASGHYIFDPGWTASHILIIAFYLYYKLYLQVGKFKILALKSV